MEQPLPSVAVQPDALVPEPPDPGVVRAMVRRALAEDVGPGRHHGNGSGAADRSRRSASWSRGRRACWRGPRWPRWPSRLWSRGWRSSTLPAGRRAAGARSARVDGAGAGARHPDGGAGGAQLRAAAVGNRNADGPVRRGHRGYRRGHRRDPQDDAGPARAGEVCRAGRWRA